MSALNVFGLGVIACASIADTGNNMPQLTDKQVVYKLICDRPGYQVSWYAWLLGGGNIVDGEPMGAMVVDFASLHKVLKVQQRVSELVRDNKVEMRTPKGKTKTSGFGVWPAYVVREKKHNTPIVEKHVVTTESGKRGIGQLRGILGGIK